MSGKDAASGVRGIDGIAKIWDSQDGLTALMMYKAAGVAVAALAWQGWRWYCRRAHQQGLQADTLSEEEPQAEVCAFQQSYFEG